MNGQPLLFALHAALALLLCIAIYTDLRSRIIPNWLNGIIVCLAMLAWIAAGLPIWPDMAIQAGIALGVFALFTIFFIINAMGGGDVKMLGALALWFPLETLIPFLVLMSLIGGAITLGMYLYASRVELMAKVRAWHVLLLVAAGFGLSRLDPFHIMILIWCAAMLAVFVMLKRRRMGKTTTKIEVPYGVAISLAGFWAIYERYLNHFG